MSYDSRTFGWNGRGFSFEVESACENVGSPVNCIVSFDRLDKNKILNIGGFGPNQFPPNTDIAGSGIIYSIISQASLVYFLAVLIMWNIFDDTSRRKKIICELLLMASDTMAILSVAYLASFVLTGKCILSTYHYYVALNTVLIALSCMVSAIIATRKTYWRNPLTGALRLLLLITTMSLLGIFVFYWIQKNGDNDFPHWSKPLHKDSTLLLPVSCFLDPDLRDHQSPFAATQNFTALTGEGPVKTKHIPHIWIYIGLVIVCVFAVGANIPYVLRATVYLCGMCSRKYKLETVRPSTNKTGKRRRRPSFGLLIVFPCIGVLSFCTWHIEMLRKWAAASTWLRDGTEKDVASVGQLLPMLVLANVLIALLGLIWDLCLSKRAASRFPSSC